MKKVIIEITEEGYKTTYIKENKTFVEEWEKIGTGARIISEIDFDSLPDDEVSDDMLEALNDKDPYEIMKALEFE